MFYTNKAKFSEIDHTADVGINATGDSLRELYANLAFGMIFIITGEVYYKKDRSLHLEIEELSDSDLLVTWLSEINYHLTVHHFIPTCISSLHIQNKENNVSLTAELEGFNTVDPVHNFNTEIKAVTYHQMEIKKTKSGYTSKVFFDI
jgi:SHS2 domain-containing protein